MRALIAVDVQEDFLTGVFKDDWEYGSILEHFWTALERAIKATDVTIFTKSVHPSNHFSFDFQFPPHCVKGKKGSRIPTELVETARASYVTTRGTSPEPPDSYSAFDSGTLRPKESLEEILEIEKVTEVDVAGLGHYWDVPQTAFDANALGYKTTVLLNICKPIDALTLSKLARAGVDVESY